MSSNQRSAQTEQALSPTNVLSLSATALGETVNLKNGYEAIALVCHASMVAVDFRLVGLEEDHTISKLFYCPLNMI